MNDNYIIVERGKLFPVKQKKNGHPGTMVGGIFDNVDKYLENSVFFRNKNRFVFPPTLNEKLEFDNIDEDVIFGGYLFNHFGHFLLESLSRLHVLDSFPDAPIVWIKEKELKPFHEEIFRIIGNNRKNIFISRPTIAERVIVGDCGFSIGAFFRDYHARYLGAHPLAFSPTQNVWLSRSGLSDKLGGFDNEKEIEDVIESKGWKIFRPEEHSISEQVDVISSCKRIAGFEGSAFHLLILIKDFNRRVDIFSRGNNINRNFELIAETKEIDQHVHYIDAVKTRGERSFSRYVASSPDEIFDIIL